MAVAWLLAAPPALAAPPPSPTEFNVLAYGAKADAQTDDTASFTKALSDAGKAGGGVVQIPAGRYRIAGSLDVPSHVTLAGVAHAPARDMAGGSILQAVSGAGDEQGTPFITLRANATLRGLTVFYPDQVAKNPPVPYPWCVRGDGDNCSIVDVLLLNPYQAVDFGTRPCGRHLIRGLYAQPLRRGLYIDQCFDVGRVRDVHFWPFWNNDTNGPVKQFTQTQGEAFLIGRTDWEYFEGCFTIWYAVGYRFMAHPQHGPGNAVFTNCGADIGPVAVRVEAVQDHAGVSFVNGQFMSGIEVLPTNRGPVKFTSCGFWGVAEGTEKFMKGHARHAVIAGSGAVTFSNCHFTAWDTRNEGEPAIYIDGGRVTVAACEFFDAKRQVVVGEKGGSAVVTGCRFRGGSKLENRGKGRLEESGNLDE
jgi:hypothetical protein